MNSDQRQDVDRINAPSGENGAVNGYDPDQVPLFAGLSVTPYVYFREPLIGNDPGKGKSLQTLAMQGEKRAEKRAHLGAE
jgi:hypothetical protein